MRRLSLLWLIAAVLGASAATARFHAPPEYFSAMFLHLLSGPICGLLVSEGEVLHAFPFVIVALAVFLVFLVFAVRLQGYASFFCGVAAATCWYVSGFFFAIAIWA